MERVRRFRLTIFATIACAVLLLTATFAVSFAKWDGGSYAPVEIEGSSGQFYVNYPQYKSELDTPAPNLADGTYYLQVPVSGTQSDYYAMSVNTAPGKSHERMLDNLPLGTTDKVSLYYGKTKVESFGRNTYSHANFKLTGDTMSFVAQGYYSFYYNTSDATMYASYSATFTAADTSAYTYTLKVKFDGETTSRTIHINSPYQPCVRIWEGGNFYYATEDNSKYPRRIEEGVTEINVGTVAGTQVIFSSAEGWDSDQCADVTLSAIASAADNYITLQTSGGTKYALANDTLATLPSPATRGATDFGGSSSGGDNELLGAMPVREVVATTTGSGDVYKYHNYICVSRVGASDAGSIAYLEFEVVGLNGTVLSNVDVTSISITRQDVYETDEGTHKAGDIKDGESTRMSPRIYGIENVNTMADINHTAVTVTPEQKENHMTDHVTGGIYCMMYFSDDDKYYAMDITITTQQQAEFRLTATANNVNQWTRYQQGFGQPYGFYLGGNINGVESWEPDFTTNLEGTVINSDSDLIKENVVPGNDSKTFLRPDYIDLCLNIRLTKDSEIRFYMTGKDGNRLVQGSIAEQTVYFIPQNLTFETMDEDGQLQEVNVESYYKERGYVLIGLDGKPVNANGDSVSESDVANQVGCEYATFVKTDDTNGSKRLTSDFNLIIPETGQYTVRFYGKVTYKSDPNERFDVVDNGTNNDMSGDNHRYFWVQDKNCYVENARIIYKSVSNVKHMVSYVSANGEGGGSILGKAVEHKGSVPSTVKVKVGDDEVNATIGDEVNGYVLEGFYTDRECTNPVVFENMQIRQNTIIYVKWQVTSPKITYGGTTKSLTLNASGTDAKVKEYIVENLDIAAGTQVTFSYGGNAITLQDLTDNPAYYKALNDNSGFTQSGSVLTATYSKPYTFYLKNSIQYPDQWCLYVSSSVYAVTFNFTDGHLINTTDTKTVIVMTDSAGKLAYSSIPIAQPDNPGKHFVEWNASADGAGDKIDSRYEYTQDTPVYAIWETSTVTLDANGGYFEEVVGSTYVKVDGKAVKQVITLTLDGAATATSQTPKRQGHEFKGWNSLNDGSGSPFGMTIASGKTFAGQTYLYAQWEEAEEVAPYYMIDGDSTKHELTVSSDTVYTAANIGQLTQGAVIKLYIDDTLTAINSVTDTSSTFTVSGGNAVAQTSGNYTSITFTLSSNKWNITESACMYDSAHKIVKIPTTGTKTYYVVGNFYGNDYISDYGIKLDEHSGTEKKLTGLALKQGDIFKFRSSGASADWSAEIKSGVTSDVAVNVYDSTTNKNIMASATASYDFYWEYGNNGVVWIAKTGGAAATYALRIKGSFDSWAKPYLVGIMSSGNWTCEFIFNLSVNNDFMFITTNIGDETQKDYFNYGSTGTKELCTGITYNGANFKCSTAGAYKFTITGNGTAVSSLDVVKV